MHVHAPFYSTAPSSESSISCVRWGTEVTVYPTERGSERERCLAGCKVATATANIAGIVVKKEGRLCGGGRAEGLVLADWDNEDASGHFL